ncbi:MAG TPA: FUSC family protein [Solirubrobacteraceae bacterium]|jgi:uncharacterized membrane protein YgaE (UPF0421/DUF939 family)
MQRVREQLAGASAHGTERWRDAWESVLLASIAAALAWLIAHRALGHPQPFFAPIAAAISLSTSRIQRSRRIVQMVGGVLIGIGVAELLVALIGTGTAAIGVIALATFTVAVLGGAGVFGQGMMFANQAVASAILVVALHRAGTGSERAVDALVGGAVALVLGVVLFPANPLRLLRTAERSVLRTLAVAVERAAGPREQLRSGEDWTLTMGYTVHQQLAALARARATAHANVRVAPRRWRLRAVVDAENDRTARLDLLANAVVGLVRATMVEERPLPEPLTRQIDALGHALDQLATVEQPWPPALREHVLGVAETAVQYASTVRREQGATTTAILGATAVDLSHLLEAEP